MLRLYLPTLSVDVGCSSTFVLGQSTYRRSEGFSRDCKGAESNFRPSDPRARLLRIHVPALGPNRGRERLVLQIRGTRQGSLAGVGRRRLRTSYVRNYLRVTYCKLNGIAGTGIVSARDRSTPRRSSVSTTPAYQSFRANLNARGAVKESTARRPKEMAYYVSKHLDVVLRYHHTPPSEGTRPGRQGLCQGVGPG
jgi:hypothetical protein